MSIISLQAGITYVCRQCVEYMHILVHLYHTHNVRVYSIMHVRSRIMFAGNQRIHDCLLFAKWSLIYENMNLYYATLLIQIPTYPYSIVGHDVSCAATRHASY